MSKNKDKKKEEEITWKTFSNQWNNYEEFREYYEIHRLICDFTEALAKIMVENGWSQQELAKKLGVSNYYLSKLLKGLKDITLRDIAKLLLKLNKRASLKFVKLEDDFVPLKNDKGESNATKRR
jgi:DNA-binding Xre family transcriptional regulator